MWAARADVEQLFEKRVPFARVEDYIDRRRDISEDDRSALWLYAWARLQHMQRRPVGCRSISRLWSAEL